MTMLGALGLALMAPLCAPVCLDDGVYPLVVVEAPVVAPLAPQREAGHVDDRSLGGAGQVVDALNHAGHARTGSTRRQAPRAPRAPPRTSVLTADSTPPARGAGMGRGGESAGRRPLRDAATVSAAT